MQDLTTGAIPRHIVKLAIPLALGMIFQTLYVLVDLYFVARLGDASIAGVSAASNLQFIVMSLTQVLGIGTMVLISHAAGRKDADDATLVFSQSIGLSAFAGVLTLLLGLFAGTAYLNTIAADAAVLREANTYLLWFLPALALQFALVSMGSALRGIGVTRPIMLIQMTTVLINAALAPVLISGWGTGRPFGVAGAGLSSTIAVAIGVVATSLYFARTEHFVRVDRSLIAPRWAVWGRILRIGVPAGGEYAILFVSMALIYVIIRDFGAAAQAGFGVGSRVMQSIFLPVMAVALAAAPVAGQNFAAGKFDRAREAFFASAAIGSALMAAMTIFAHVSPESLVRPFSSDPAVLEVAAHFLSTISWNFVASGLVFTCSGMFQAMGNTLPSVIASAVRLTAFAVPAVIISRLPGFQIHWIWRVSVAATTLHAIVALALLRLEASRRLGPVGA